MKAWTAIVHLPTMGNSDMLVWTRSVISPFVYKEKDERMQEITMEVSGIE